MKSLERKLLWCAFVTYLSAPAIAYSAPGALADQPLWLGSAVKHNIMFAIDDSGSMDFELLLDNDGGTAYIREGNGNISKANGTLYPSGNDYAYLFPNGQNSTYNGKRLYNNQYALPPIPQYGFARSSDFNKAYYNPAETYLPWVNYNEYTGDEFINVSVTDTPFEPVSSFGGGTINLFQNLNTVPKSQYWKFDIRSAAMVCDADGSSGCTDNSSKDWSYYPATYYSKDTTSTYYYHAGGGENPARTTSNSKLIEAESVATSGRMLNAAALDTGSSGDENTDINSVKSGASDNDFVGTFRNVGGLPSSDGNAVRNASTTSAPTGTAYGGVTYTIQVPESGKQYIWIRNAGFSSSTDSVWGKLLKVAAGGNEVLDEDDGVNLINGNSTGWVADGYGALRDTVSQDGSWTWSKWAEVTLDKDENYQFELAYREGGFLIDQIMFTTVDGTPVGTDFSSVTTPSAGTERSCATAADTTPAIYLEYARNPGRFRVGDSQSAFFDAFAYDGSCLKKYEIPADTSISFDNGAGNNRSTADEKQNFANWFTYYRRRHQAMRGGLASAMKNINGVKAGMFWINNRRTVGAAEMNDMSETAGVSNFLTEHFQYVNKAGTPLRSALNHARKQFKSTSGPITSECQKNYTLLFTDGYNYETSLDNMGNEDASAGAPYQDTYSDTLGDIAWRAYTENSRDDLLAGNVRVSEKCDVDSPDPWLDCNTNPHMNTYTVGLGNLGTIYGVTHHDVEDAYTTPPTWPDVNQDADATQIDDLYHAAVNGRGAMFNAQTPALLGTALGAAIDDIAASIGSGSGVTFNSSSLKADDGTAIYTTLFNSANWSGDIEGRLLDSTTGEVKDLVWGIDDDNDDVIDTPMGAAGLLDARDLDASPSRVILTHGATDGVGFQWDKLTAAQKNDLKSEPTDTGTPSGTDAQGLARLDYFRGDRTLEAGTLRKRGSLMSDVIHSAPVYVGVPGSNWPNEDGFGTSTARYSTFQKAQKDRTPTVYVGANGGMLHGFNAQNSGADAGQEVMAYVPGLVYSTQSGKGLHYLTDPNYSHEYYVDLTPVQQDVYTKGSVGGSAAWRTMLVGGLRGGGKGLFALDVTDPSSFSEDTDPAANTVMWEFSDTDDANLGYLVTPPLIAMLNNGKWAVIFGNGYESTNGRAALMILFVEEGLDGWAVDDKVVIDTGVGTSLDKNGLSGITAVDMDGDSIPDIVYAGDVKGNMWSFDIADGDHANWGVTYALGGNPAPLFTATDANGKGQPITAPPSIAVNSENTSGGYEPNLLVAFGTGQYLADGDQSNTDVQSFYSIWDKGDGSKVRSNISLRTMTESNNIRGVSGSAINWASDYGWGMDFRVSGQAADGERVTQKPIMLYDETEGPIALFASLLPDTSECSGGGQSVLYAMTLLNGLNPSKPILDLNNDGKFDLAGSTDVNGNPIAGDTGIGKRSSEFINDPNVLGNNIYSANKDQSGDGSGISKEEHNARSASEREGRLGWFELIAQ